MEKNVLIIGMGLSGISAYSFLIKNGYVPIFFDDQYFETEDFIDLVKTCEFVVISPTVKKSHKLISVALEEDIKVINEIDLAYLFRSNKSTIIGVTGTNGKTTVTTLISTLLGQESIVAGNIGIPWSSLANKDYKSVVLELSSFQLSSIEYFKPNIAVLLNVAPDHLDWHDSFNDYLNSKLNIIKNATDDTIVIYCGEDKNLMDAVHNKFKKGYYFSADRIEGNGAYVDEEDNIVVEIDERREKLFPISEINYYGRHNLLNILASCLVAKLLGISSDLIMERLKNYKYLDYRLNKLSLELPYTIINDSKSTNLASALVALEAVKEPIVLIVGGKGKKESYQKLFDFKEKLKHIIAYGEAGEEFLKASKEVGFSKIEVVNRFDDAVKRSLEVVEAGDTLLLSPACSSFDQFSSYKERGEVFNKIVKSYLNS